MATQKEQTLQIKQWKGVDRFTEGTNQQPDVFEVIQNMNIVNPGEVASLSGVTPLKTISGVSSILHTKFLDNANDDYLVMLVKSDSSAIQAATGYTFSTSGAGVTTYKVWIEHVGLGGKTSIQSYTNILIQANGLTVTLPALDATVRSVNVYVETPYASPAPYFGWMGSFFRKVTGTFPTSATFQMISTGYPDPSTISSPFPVGAHSITQTNTPPGNLLSDKIYYLGLSASFGMLYGDSSYVPASVAFNSGGSAASAGSVMSFYLPSGYKTITASFYYCPYGGVEVSTSSVPDRNLFTMNRPVVLIGTTPEDLMPINSAGLDGVSRAATMTQTTVASTSVNLSGAGSNPNTFVMPKSTFINASGQKELTVGTTLTCTARTGATTAGEPVANKHYYVSSISTSGSNYIIGLSATLGGAALTLTTITQITLGFSTVTVSINTLPHSLILGCSCVSFNAGGSAIPTAVPGRTAGAWLTYRYQNLTANTTAGVSAISYLDSSMDDTKRRDCFIQDYSPGANLGNVNAVTIDGTNHYNGYPQSFINDTDEFQSRQYGNRLWIANGYNEPFYCNGTVLKPGIPSAAISTDTTARWPITKYIEFYKNRMCLANGSSNATGASSAGAINTAGAGNPTYQEGLVYLSDSSGDINYFNYVAGTPKYISVSTGDQSKIKGLNVYSQDLTSVGAETFLVIGKESTVFVWGGDLATAPKQISKATGFAGPNCYALTKFGPMFIGNDNVYLFRSSQDITPICNNFKDIIKGLTDTQLYAVSVVFHDEDLKIGYTEVSGLDRELWLRPLMVPGGMDMKWSGPHSMTSYTGQTIIPVWGTDRNYRISTSGVIISRRDDPGSFQDSGQPINRRLKIRNLGLQSDHLLKLITRLNLHLRLTADEDFTITLESEDGSISFVDTFTAQNTGNARRLRQFIMPQRWLARVVTLTIENSNNSDLSIYDLSLLFQPLRRRQLP